MGKFFISYRRSDSAGYAGRLADSLEERFGTEQFFRDIEQIPFGGELTEVIDRALDESDAMLVVIGPGWVTATNEHGLRLFQDGDWVRREVAAALARGDVTVIPVLVDGAHIPRADELPPDLAPLTTRLAAEMSETRWDYDLDRLADRLEEVVDLVPATEIGEPTAIAADAHPAEPSRPAWLPYIAGAALIAVVAIVVAVLTWGGSDDDGGSAAPATVALTSANPAFVEEVETFEVAGARWTTVSHPPGVKQVDWPTANEWCAQVPGADFRLPTIAELESIVDPDGPNARGYYILSVFSEGIGGNWVWSSEREGTDAMYYDFAARSVGSSPTNFDEGIQVLCIADVA